MVDTFPSKLRPLIPWLPTIANLVLVVAIGLTAARLFWLFWPAGPADPVPAAAEAPRAPERIEVDVDRIAAADLFGSPAREEAGQPIIDAPETHLNLTLTGIVARESGPSLALIATENGEQDAYAVGDYVTGDVRLHAIYATRVILNRNGRFETLTLERELVGEDGVRPGGGSRDGREPDTGGAGGTVSDDMAETLSRVREEILEQPSRVTEYVRLQPQRQNGNLAGYRIYPGQDRALFQRLGLRPGELVTAINGVSLEDPQQALQVLSEVAQADSVTVTLERGGQQRTLNVEFE